MKRFLARHISFCGIDYRMSVAQFSDDFSSVEIFPFREETASTCFLDGRITIRKSEDRYIIEREGRGIDLP